MQEPAAPKAVFHPARRRFAVLVGNGVLLGAFAATALLASGRFNAVRTLEGIVLCAMALVLSLSRLGSWSATVEPLPGTPAVGPDQLRRRILSLNALRLPFAVREAGPLLVVAWLGRSREGKVESITLAFDEDERRVRALESEVAPWEWSEGVETDALSGSVEASAEEAEAGLQTGAFAGVKSETSFTRRIPLETYVPGARVGLSFEGGAFVPAPHDYAFDIVELRQPLVEAVAVSGWSYVPVLTFVSPLGP